MKHNPYIGPRPYGRNEGNFFGRSREARSLTALIMTNQVLLYYARSGAGKTSLLNALVIPELEKNDYYVLPVARVGGDLPPKIGYEQVKNVFAFSSLLDLAGEQAAPQPLLATSLLDGLQAHLQVHGIDPQARPPLLILDQFEEILTTHRTRWQDAKGFFLQVREALKALPTLGVVFAMREDHLAGLDPYTPLLPGRLQARFRMELLEAQGALEAVRGAAASQNITYAEGVAERLVDDLRRIKTQQIEANARHSGGDRDREEVLGQYIEPVQLQIVCNRLWANLPDGKTDAIQWDEVERYGNIDQALTGFYEDALQACRTSEAVMNLHPPVTERRLRRWFGDELITQLGTRGLALQDEETGETAGLPNAAVVVLDKQHIIRSETRAGARWYELSHDRLVEPIVKSNRVWKEKQSAEQARERPWLPVAQRWQETRDSTLLYRGKPLEEALSWQAAHPDEMEPEESKFLEASRNAEQDRTRQRPWLLIARRWQETKDNSLLYRDKALQDALTWAKANPNEVEAAETDFLKAGQKAEQMRTTRQRLFTAGGILGVIILLVMAGLTWWAINSQQMAITQRQVAVDESNKAAVAKANAEAASTRAVAAEVIALKQRDEIKRLSERQKYLSEMGWGAIFAANADPAVREALSELLDLRRKQATQNHDTYYKEYTGEDGYRPGDTARDFLVRHGVSLGPVNPNEVPYYLLIVGDPESIPYEFQYQLDTKYAVGRIHFETLAEYANYAHSVVEAEARGIELPRQVTLFGVANPDDQGTKLSSQYLVEPLYAHLKESKPDWPVNIFFKDAATKAQLARLLGGDQTPVFLFTASHSIVFPLDNPNQLSSQGALLCQDWPGPEVWQGELGKDFYFAADDVDENAQLLGLIMFSFASYGAGTPKYNDYSLAQSSNERKQLASQAFVARLPQHLLSHPKGGALAVIGQTGPGWGYSFVQSGAEQATAGTFYKAVDQLLEGYPVGAAMEPFNQRYAELATELDAWLLLMLEQQPGTLKMPQTLLMTLDARDYVIVGDPAVRLVNAEGANLDK